LNSGEKAELAAWLAENVPRDLYLPVREAASRVAGICRT